MLGEGSECQHAGTEHSAQILRPYRLQPSATVDPRIEYSVDLLCARYFIVYWGCCSGQMWEFGASISRGEVTRTVSGWPRVFGCVGITSEGSMDVC